jgi:phage portal protein BeeE
MNAGRPYIAEGGAEYKPISINPEDAQMLETRGFSVDEICRFFGVPPFMIGHTEKSTSWGTGLAEQVLGFQKFNLRRRLKRIEQSMEKRLLTPQDRAGGVTVEFNLEGLLRGDSAARAAFYQSGLSRRLDDHQRGPRAGKPAAGRGWRRAAHADAERADHRGRQAAGGQPSQPRRNCASSGANR